MEEYLKKVNDKVRELLINTSHKNILNTKNTYVLSSDFKLISIEYVYECEKLLATNNGIKISSSGRVYTLYTYNSFDALLSNSFQKNFM